MASRHERQLVSETELSQGRPGRPPAITRETADNLTHLVESGFTIDQACALEGVGRSTVSRYLLSFPGFRTALTRARRDRALKIARLRQEAMEVAAATGDWRAIHMRFESEIRQLEREIAQGAWGHAVDEGLIDLVTEAVRSRLDRRPVGTDVACETEVRGEDAGAAGDDP